MQFVVPQFIDVEDKIIGPITVRQFIMIIVAGIFLFIEYKLSDLALFIVLAVPTIVIFGAFAFVKINGMPFHYFVLNAVKTLKKPKIRIWHRQVEISSISKNSKAKDQDQDEEVESKRPTKKLVTSSHLSDLALLIDTGGLYKGSQGSNDISFNNNDQS